MILRIFAWIVSRVVRLFTWLLLKTIWRPVVIVLSILLRYIIIPVLVTEVSELYGLTPIIASSIGPYVFTIVKLGIDSCPTLRWLVFFGLGQFTSWILNAGFRVSAFVWRIVVWVVRFAWWSCRSICTRFLQAIRACVLTVCALPRAIRGFFQSLWSRWWTLFAYDPARGWWGLGAILVIVALLIRRVFEFARVLTLMLLTLRPWCSEVALFAGSASHVLIWELPPVAFAALSESELCQTLKFWWDWIILPVLDLMPEEDMILIIVIAFFCSFTRWMLSSQWGERAARAKLLGRIKMLEARL
ncbi:hypothetical protein K438DRAFT_1879680 [Mycena galopus ATCC 62051]|nr:hypothetical protein K438DRAFT_1879680 [Mycena galopus ATCC 62051]